MMQRSRRSSSPSVGRALDVCDADYDADAPLTLQIVCAFVNTHEQGHHYCCDVEEFSRDFGAVVRRSRSYGIRFPYTAFMVFCEDLPPSLPGNLSADGARRPGAEPRQLPAALRHAGGGRRARHPSGPAYRAGGAQRGARAGEARALVDALGAARRRAAGGGGSPRHVAHRRPRRGDRRPLRAQDSRRGPAARAGSAGGLRDAETGLPLEPRRRGHQRQRASLLEGCEGRLDRAALPNAARGMAAVPRRPRLRLPHQPPARARSLSLVAPDQQVPRLAAARRRRRRRRPGGPCALKAAACGAAVRGSHRVPAAIPRHRATRNAAIDVAHSVVRRVWQSHRQPPALLAAADDPGHAGRVLAFGAPPFTRYGMYRRVRRDAMLDAQHEPDTFRTIASTLQGLPATARKTLSTAARA